MAEDTARENPVTRLEGSGRIARSEFIPERRPQPLSRVTERAAGQLAAIATSPTEQQIAQVAVHFNATRPEGHPLLSEEETKEGARNAFTNFQELSRQAAVAQEKASALWREALRAGRADTPAKKAEYEQAARERDSLLGQRRDAVREFRASGLQIEPDQQGKITLSERVFQQGPRTMGFEGARAVTAGGRAARGIAENTREGGKRAGRAVRTGVEATARGARTTARRGVEVSRAATGDVASGVRTSAEAAARAVRSGVETTRTTASTITERTGVAIAAGRERVAEAWRDRVRQGRELVQRVVVAAETGINTARAEVSGRWNSVVESTARVIGSTRGAAGTQVGQVRSGLGGLVGEIGRRITGVRESVSNVATQHIEASRAWAGTIGGEVLEKTTNLTRGVGEAIARAREGAAGRRDAFVGAMRSAGEGVANITNEVVTGVREVLTAQAARVALVEERIRRRVGEELSFGLEKAKLLAAPFLESVRRDRETIRDYSGVTVDKLGLLVEGASDFANPMLERVMDNARDARDRALGLGQKQIEGARILGRRLASTGREAVTPLWDALCERWESMRLRSNDARGRLNAFLNERLEGTGNRFRRLKESVDARAVRAGVLVAGAWAEAGRVVSKGGLLRDEAARRFVENAAQAREFLESQRENIARSMEAMRGYIRLDALRRWAESGMSNVDIRRRDLVMRGMFGAQIAAAKAGEAAFRGASLAVAGVAETSKVVREHPKTAVVLMAAAGGAYVLLNAAHPDFGTYVQSLMQGLGGLFEGASSVSNPDVLQPVAGIDAGVTGRIDTSLLPGSEAVQAGASIGAEALPNAAPFSPTEAASQIPNIPGANEVAAGAAPVTGAESAPSNVVTEAQPTTPFAAPTEAGPATTALPTTTEGGTGTTTSAEAPLGAERNVESPVQLPRTGEALVNPDLVQRGEMVYPQAERIASGLPGGATVENVNRVMAEIFSRFQGDFEASARAIVNNPTAYSTQIVSDAQTQLDAIAALRQNPQAVQQYSILSNAMHFWSPNPVV